MKKNNNIFKWFSMFLLMMVAAIPGASAQSLSIDNFSINPEGSKDVTIKLVTGENTIYGIQTDILLSDGLTLESISAVDTGLSFSSNTLTDGTIRIALLSLGGNSIPAGNVITMKVTAAKEFNGGTIKLANTRLTITTTGTEIKPEDVTTNVTVSGESAVYTVAGAWGDKGEGAEDLVFGYSWRPTLEENDMKAGDDGIYTLVKKEVQLSAGTIYYKVVKNHSWDTSWGFGSENANYVVNEEGLYDITFKFNPNELLSNGYNLTCEVVKHASPEFDYDKISIDPADHTTVESLQNFTLTFGGQTVTVNSEVKPTLGDALGEIALNDDGSVAVTFTSPQTAPGNYTLDIPSGAILYYGSAINPLSFTYTIAGGADFTIDPAEGEVEALENFTITFHNYMVDADDDASAVLQNTTTNEEVNGSTFVIAGGTKVYVTLNSEVKTPGTYKLIVTGVKTFESSPVELIFNYTIKGEPETVYTVAGAFGESVSAGTDDVVFSKAWDPTLEDNDLTKGEDDIFTLTKKGVVLEAGTIYYKVVKNHSWDTNWGFGGADADYIVYEAGTYDITFKFNPDALLDNGYNLTCEVKESSATGIVDIANSNTEGAAIYTLQGVRVNKIQKGLMIINGKKVIIR